MEIVKSKKSLSNFKLAQLAAALIFISSAQIKASGFDEVCFDMECNSFFAPEIIERSSEFPFFRSYHTFYGHAPDSEKDRFEEINSINTKEWSNYLGNVLNEESLSQLLYKVSLEDLTKLRNAIQGKPTDLSDELKAIKSSLDTLNKKDQVLAALKYLDLAKRVEPLTTRMLGKDGWEETPVEGSDPKTVLTLQAALPKVVISLVLITFSFAIGATMTNFIFPLRKISDNILVSLKDDIRGETIEDGVKVKVLAAFALPAVIGGLIPGAGGAGALLGAASTLSVGAISFMFTGLLAMALLVVTILVYLKTLIIYVRMLGSVVFSPLIFAWGAIPGNDAATINWFKSMVAKLISVVGMYFLLKLSEFVPRYAFYSGLFGPNITSFSGGMIADFFKGSLQIYLIMLMTPFISMMLCIQALSVPKKVEGWILGQKR
jgi:hypothetical protein